MVWNWLTRLPDMFWTEKEENGDRKVEMLEGNKETSENSENSNQMPWLSHYCCVMPKHYRLFVDERGQPITDPEKFPLMVLDTKRMLATPVDNATAQEITRHNQYNNKKAIHIPRWRVETRVSTKEADRLMKQIITVPETIRVVPGKIPIASRNDVLVIDNPSEKYDSNVVQNIQKPLPRIYLNVMNTRDDNVNNRNNGTIIKLGSPEDNSLNYDLRVLTDKRGVLYSADADIKETIQEARDWVGNDYCKDLDSQWYKSVIEQEKNKSNPIELEIFHNSEIIRKRKENLIYTIFSESDKRFEAIRHVDDSLVLINDKNKLVANNVIKMGQVLLSEFPICEAVPELSILSNFVGELNQEAWNKILELPNYNEKLNEIENEALNKLKHKRDIEHIKKLEKLVYVYKNHGIYNPLTDAMGIYYLISFAGESCQPNAIFTVHKNLAIGIAIRDIGIGDEITTCRVGYLFLPSWARNQIFCSVSIPKCNCDVCLCEDSIISKSQCISSDSLRVGCDRSIDSCDSLCIMNNVGSSATIESCLLLGKQSSTLKSLNEQESTGIEFGSEFHKVTSQTNICDKSTLADEESIYNMKRMVCPDGETNCSGKNANLYNKDAEELWKKLIDLNIDEVANVNNEELKLQVNDFQKKYGKHHWLVASYNRLRSICLMQCSNEQGISPVYFDELIASLSSFLEYCKERAPSALPVDAAPLLVSAMIICLVKEDVDNFMLLCTQGYLTALQLRFGHWDYVVLALLCAREYVVGGGMKDEKPERGVLQMIGLTCQEIQEQTFKTSFDKSRIHENKLNEIRRKNLNLNNESVPQNIFDYMNPMDNMNQTTHRDLLLGKPITDVTATHPDSVTNRFFPKDSTSEYPNAIEFALFGPKIKSVASNTLQEESNKNIIEQNDENVEQEKELCTDIGTIPFPGISGNVPGHYFGLHHLKRVKNNVPSTDLPLFVSFFDKNLKPDPNSQHHQSMAYNQSECKINSAVEHINHDSPSITNLSNSDSLSDQMYQYADHMEDSQGILNDEPYTLGISIATVEVLDGPYGLETDVLYNKYQDDNRSRTVGCNFIPPHTNNYRSNTFDQISKIPPSPFNGVFARMLSLETNHRGYRNSRTSSLSNERIRRIGYREFKPQAPIFAKINNNES